jgi:hypothetical protein
MSELGRLLELLVEVLAGATPTDREIRKTLAVGHVLEGRPVDIVAATFRLQRKGLEEAATRTGTEGLSGLFPDYEARTGADEFARRRRGIAQMLLGTLGERRFQEISEEVTGRGVIRIEDHRPSRSDTDYRLLNGSDNPVCRINIKFHGTLFRDSQQYVGLEPVDCFPLATYKIHNALRRQQARTPALRFSHSQCARNPYR